MWRMTHHYFTMWHKFNWYTACKKYTYPRIAEKEGVFAPSNRVSTQLLFSIMRDPRSWDLFRTFGLTPLIPQAPSKEIVWAHHPEDTAQCSNRWAPHSEDTAHSSLHHARAQKQRWTLGGFRRCRSRHRQIRGQEPGHHKQPQRGSEHQEGEVRWLYDRIEILRQEAERHKSASAKDMEHVAKVIFSARDNNVIG